MTAPAQTRRYKTKPRAPYVVKPLYQDSDKHIRQWLDAFIARYFETNPALITADMAALGAHLNARVLSVREYQHSDKGAEVMTVPYAVLCSELREAHTADKSVRFAYFSLGRWFRQTSGYATLYYARVAGRSPGIAPLRSLPPTITHLPFYHP